MIERAKELQSASHNLNPSSEGKKRFCVCTLVTRFDEYEEMLTSFEAKGFNTSNTEFFYIDNSSGNQHNAYSGGNSFITHSHCDYIIYCHQDIVLHDSDYSQLSQRISELDDKDPLWAVCGNAGCDASGMIFSRISDPHGENTRIGRLPIRVESLDENFLLIRKSANLGFSSNLSGFHFYGLDICLSAWTLGRSAYVIDFHLRHKSAGNLSNIFWQEKENFVAKWGPIVRNKLIYTTCTTLRLTDVPILRLIFNEERADRKRWKLFASVRR